MIVRCCRRRNVRLVRRWNRLEGASAANLGEWQARTFPTMAPRATPFLDELPADLFADRVETRAGIERASRDR